MESIVRVNDEIINRIELAMKNANNPIACPVIHRFVDGMYSREIFMPANQIVTSRVHKEEGFFTISQGVVAVSIDMGEWIIYAAPFTGKTKIGTKRMIYIISDTIWVTYHLNLDNNRNIDELEERLAEWNNPLLTNQNELQCHFLELA